MCGAAIQHGPDLVLFTGLQGQSCSRTLKPSRCCCQDSLSPALVFEEQLKDAMLSSWFQLMITHNVNIKNNKGGIWFYCYNTEQELNTKTPVMHWASRRTLLIQNKSRQRRQGSWENESVLTFTVGRWTVSHWGFCYDIQEKSIFYHILYFFKCGSCVAAPVTVCKCAQWVWGLLVCLCVTNCVCRVRCWVSMRVPAECNGDVVGKQQVWHQWAPW